MRYMIYFRDKSTMHVSQKIGDKVMDALSNNSVGHVVLNGMWINKTFITIVKPIKMGFFPKDFVEQQERLELESPETMKLLPPQQGHGNE